MPEKSSRRRRAWQAFSVFVAGLALVSFMEFGFYSPYSFMKYPEMAALTASGQVESERLLDFSPINLYLHLLLHRAFSEPLFPARLLHVALIALCYALWFLVLRRFFPLWLALVGTVMFVLDWHVLVYGGMFAPEALLLFFLLAFVYCMPRPQIRWRFFAGLFFALCLLCRPNLFVLFFLMPLVLFFLEKNKTQWLRACLVFSMPVVIAILGLWLRNSLIERRFSPLVMNPGTVIYEGNNPCSVGQSGVYPILVREMIADIQAGPDAAHAIYREFARRITGKQLSIVQVNSFWTRKIKNYLLDHPGQVFKLFSIKLTMFFHDHRLHDIPGGQQREAQLDRAHFPRIPFFLISILALWGMIGGRKRWREFFLLYLVFFIQMVIVLTAYVSARQRMIVVPFFIFFACLALDNFRKNWRSLLLFLPFGALLFFPLGRPNDWVREDRHLAQNQFIAAYSRSMAKQERSAGRLDSGARYACLAFAAYPALHDWLRISSLPYGPMGGFASGAIRAYASLEFHGYSSLFDLATLCLQAGRYRDAEKYFLQVLLSGYSLNRSFFQSSDVLFFLARLHWLAGKKKSAAALLRQGLDRSPGNPYLLSYIAALTGDAAYRAKLSRYHDEIDASFLAGQAYLETGQYEKALPEFAYVVERIPEFRRGLIYYAVALGRLERLALARKWYWRAMRRRADPVFFEDDIVAIFRKLVSQNEHSGQAWFEYGVVLRQFGRFAAAMQAQQKALAIAPSSAAAAKEIAFLRQVL